jgi:hypothetical protein
VTPSIKETVERLRVVAHNENLNNGIMRGTTPVMLEAADTIERLAGALEPLLLACIEEYGEPDGNDMTHVGWKVSGEPMAITFQMLEDARRALSGEPT